MKGDSRLLLLARLAETRNTADRQRLLKDIWQLERREREAETERMQVVPPPVLIEIPSSVVIG